MYNIEKLLCGLIEEEEESKALITKNLPNSSHYIITSFFFHFFREASEWGRERFLFNGFSSQLLLFLLSSFLRLLYLALKVLFQPLKACFFAFFIAFFPFLYFIFFYWQRTVNFLPISFSVFSPSPRVLYIILKVIYLFSSHIMNFMPCY